MARKGKKNEVAPDAPPAAAGDSSDAMAEEKNVVCIVGIGASAGGIEAFGDFLVALPEDTGMAFILVQHLDPVHESVLDKIFQRKSAVPVKQATEGMPVERDHVYVIPPNKHIGIVDGRLVLTPRDRDQGKFMPIDRFFESLASTWGNRAIGIVLSGTGNDGTRGLCSIKSEGGITFAQDELTARYTDMPKSAVAARGVDFVLPPEGIATELARMGKNPLMIGKASEDSEEGVKDDIALIYRLLKSAFGTDFSYYKASTISRRIVRRMTLAKLTTVREYYEHLRKDRSELEALSNDLFICVTSFFRDPEIFDTLREEVFPELFRARHADAPVRIWVPACSTGEEAYSLAICLVEAAGERVADSFFQIFATDISDRVVDRARTGLYPESISADVSEARLRRFFTRAEGGYQINREIRDMCVFARQDLTKDPPFSRMDLISCRNLLIYLTAQQQKRIISQFHYSLNHDGILVLGCSESIGSLGHLFAPVDKKFKIYRKKQAAHYLDHDFMVPRFPGGKEEPTGRRAAEAAGFDVQKEADRIILASYAPASILISDQLDIIQFRGITGRYMAPSSGTASLNLLKMVREELLLEIRALVTQSRKQNAPVHRSNVPVTIEGEVTKVDVHVVPVRPPEYKVPRHFLIIFRESYSTTGVAPEASAAADGNVDLRQEQLRQDLLLTRESLQTALEEKDAMNEEFRSAMEEIQSSNEELQSTNEELETTKEELQSTNEELITVNEEMQNRNAELARTNDDLVNLLNNVSLPLVILTEDLRIRRYTSMAENLLNLLPSDVGRPFFDLRTKMACPGLEEILHDVLQNMAPRAMELQDEAGRWYKLRVRPFTTHDKKVDGVVMTLLDIDDMKRTMERLRLSQSFSDAIIDTVREPLLVLDPGLRVLVANRSFYRYFRVSSSETEGNYIYNLGKGQWDIPELRRLLEEILPNNTSFDDFVIEKKFPHLGMKRLILNARKVQPEEDRQAEGKILLAIEEHRGEP